MIPLNVGLVPYLNVLPLAEGIEHFFPRIVRATPRDLAAMLAAGEIDVATLPAFDLLRAGHVLLPHGAIACDGPVRSVQLYSRVPLGDIRRVLLDRSSLTSVHLARILWRELLNIDPAAETSAEPIAPDFDLAASGFDAAVVIGDAALAMEHRFPHALDLGEGWKRLTGLPFVFAAWVARAGIAIPAEAVDALRACRDAGKKAAADIARRHVAQHPSVDDLEGYLTRSIRYNLGVRELAALDLFRGKLIAHGMLDPQTPPARRWSSEDQPAGSS